MPAQCHRELQAVLDLGNLVAAEPKVRAELLLRDRWVDAAPRSTVVRSTVVLEGTPYVAPVGVARVVLGKRPVEELVLGAQIIGDDTENDQKWHTHSSSIPNEVFRSRRERHAESKGVMYWDTSCRRA